MTRLVPLSQSYGYPSVRRYPRTLAEAWPRDHARAIEHYPAVPRWERLAGVLLAVATGIALAAALVAWWSA